MPAPRRSLLCRALAAAIVLALPAADCAAAGPHQLKELEVEHAFATPTPPGAPTGAVYLKLANRGRAPDRLVEARTPRAKSVQLHTILMDGEVMRMREVKAIELAPGESVAMRPGAGVHLMLAGLTAPLKTGERFPMTLRFEKSGTLKIEVAVELAPKKQAAQDHRH